MTLQTMLNEAADSRPGQQLVCFKEAGLPFYVLNVRLLVKEVRAIPPVEAAVLRSVRAGLTLPDEIYHFLGLPERALIPVLAELNKKELIQYTRAVGSNKATVALTGPGRLAVAEACAVVPIERTVPICWDALTRQVVNISPEQLTRPRDMAEMGRYEVPGASARDLTPADIPLDFFDGIIARHKPAIAIKQELVAVKSIERRELRFLDCLMLYYRRTSEPDVIDVGFWREDGASMAHEQAFREFGGPDQVGARLLTQAQSAQETEGIQPELVSSEATQAKAPNSQEAEDREGSTLQSLLCHQHPVVLQDALKKAKKRLMIISPWIRHHVVDQPFLKDLEAALRRGVKVHIGYGIDEGDRAKKPGARKIAGASKPPITPQAKSALEALAKRYTNFVFIYIGNTHRKMLVCDTDFSVITSFNWLSYRGSPKDKPRDEYGQLIRKRHYVEQHYAEGLKLIEQGYSGA